MHVLSAVKFVYIEWTQEPLLQSFPFAKHLLCLERVETAELGDSGWPCCQSEGISPVAIYSVLGDLFRCLNPQQLVTMVSLCFI